MGAKVPTKKSFLFSQTHYSTHMNPIEALEKTERLFNLLVNKQIAKGGLDAQFAEASAVGTIRGLLTVAVVNHPEIQALVESKLKELEAVGA